MTRANRDTGVRLSQDEVRAFAEWSGDVNPLHVDPAVARTTFFGRPVAHGMLSVLHLLAARSRADGRTLHRLDVEFKGAVFPDRDYHAEVSEREDGSFLSLRDGEGGVVLTAHESQRGDTPSDLNLAAEPWPRAGGTVRRTAPAERTIEDLAHPFEVTGTYDTGPVPGHYAQHIPAGQARVLALCSYVVGMELPGLRSLFTRASIRFVGDRSGSGPLRYSARVVRFDPTFRLLDTRVHVVGDAGNPVAICDLRSYVRVTPLAVDPAVVARWLDPSVRERVAGKTALVSGASRGLGAGIAAALALSGCRVYGTYRSDVAGAELLERELAARGLSIRMLRGDAGDAAWCDAAREEIEREHGGLDLLVLNACAPATRLRLGPGTAAAFNHYVTDNLRLATTPLSTFLPVLERRGGAVACVSSMFVEEPPAGFGHYVALKRAVEETVRAASVDAPGLYTLIARPGRLQTAWNDVPTAIAGSMPPDVAAAQIVNRLAVGWQPGHCEVFAEFVNAPPAPAAPVQPPSFTVAVAATFTVEPLLPGLRFWFDELNVSAGVELAPYNQVLQTLLSPEGLFRRNARGANVVLLRLSDWLRELPVEQMSSAPFVSQHLHAVVAELVRALQADRAQSRADMLLVVCPSSEALDPAVREAVAGAETGLRDALARVPGVTVALARDLHAVYGVTPNTVHDPVRDDIGHIPFTESYFRVLATLIARRLHHRFAPLRKVVVVDCDNTLWDGVVGEVGADGVRVEEQHRELQATLARLAANGVLVALCSKNEESDVWQVFESRPDMPLRREHLVAAMVNWRPKGDNLRTLAARLNLGLDSFIFIDDNPVECAEVRASCPEVLTLQWPSNADGALRLLSHTWELDARATTAEDRARTDSYRDEIGRQELRDNALTFREFIEGLELVIDIRPVDEADLPRASQLTFRTNQFNFTTRRRTESELRAIVADGRHEAFTVRVRDRFGDYGLVGLVITEDTSESAVFLDTFLLSCRVLGRGVEHRIVSEIGRRVSSRGLSPVRLRIEPTKRNAPARAFLASIAGAALATRDGDVVEWVAAPVVLEAVQFSPEQASSDIGDAGTSDVTESAPIDAERVRARERQVTRAAEALSSVELLNRAISQAAPAAGTTTRKTGLSGEGDPASSVGKHAAGGRPNGARASETASPSSIASVRPTVLRAFEAVLGRPAQEIAAVDRLEALGCDSMKIVEITVALLEQFPSLPHTLLFEHRSVSEIVRAIEVRQASDGAELTADATSAVTAPPAHEGFTEAATDIAVIGMHVRCAGAASPQELWSLLAGGTTAVRPVSADRPYFLHTLEDSRPHWAGLLDDVDRFDSRFFGISPKEAEVMDPQLRLFLEVAWHALEDSGCSVDRDPETGVFAGVMYGDYRDKANRASIEAQTPYRSWEGFSLANRVSQTFGFQGPSLAVDTACSSSGTALHLACRALNAGDCRVAVVGGVNLILDPDRFTSLGRLGILSATGRCLAFGAEADGTVLGEGAAVVILRPLADAVRRGDRIYGVIKGTGVSVGSGTIGFTAPNPQAQAEAIRRSLRAAGIDPRTVSYVETHGTGTSLGDPIEVRGLSLAHDDGTLHDARVTGDEVVCRLGSIKPNVGHLEAGAGVIGLIKVLLQMQHRMLVPSLTSAEPNPQIPFGETRFEVQRTLERWDRPVLRIDTEAVPVPRRAGVSSFGVGGANAHVIVEEPPERAVRAASAMERLLHVLTLSGPTEEALRHQLTAFNEWATTSPEGPLPDVCHTASVERTHHAHRAAIVAKDLPAVQEGLSRLLAGRDTPLAVVSGPLPSGSPRPAVLFTGQGSQHAGMGRALYESQPTFKEALDRCALLLDPLLDRPLFSVMFAELEGPDAQLVHLTGYTQPVLFAFEYATFQLWRSWGVEPAAVMGHSVGEIAALCVAEGISLEDATRLIAARGRLMQALPAGGGMASVMAGERTVLEALAAEGGTVAIAALNTPGQVVISGDGEAVGRIAARLASQGVRATPLVVSHAFHSPLMRPMLAEYERVVRATSFSSPRIPFISGVTGTRVDAEACEPDYWIRQVLEPVRFADGMRALHDIGTKTYLEVGPQPVLLGMGRQCVPDEGQRWLASARKDTDAWQTILAALARLHVDGASIDWKAFDAPYTRRRVSLPPYAFAQTRHWIGTARPGTVGTAPLNQTAARRPQPARELGGPGAYELRWVADPFVENASVPDVTGSQWLICGGASGVGDLLAERLRTAGASCTLVERGTQPAPDDVLSGLEGHAPVNVVCLWPLDHAPGVQGGEDPARAACELVERTVSLAQSAVRRKAGALWFVTQGATAAGSSTGEAVSIAQSSLWGMARTLWLEHPEISGGIVDLPAGRLSDDALVLRLAAELTSKRPGRQAALRTDGVLRPRLQPFGASADGGAHIDGEGSYLITGGLGAIGLHVARWLVSRGARNLVLCGRRGSDTPGAADAVADLERAGATVRVEAGDVGDRRSVHRIVEAAQALAPLRGVFHAAGVDTPRTLRDLTPEAVASVLVPKAAGAWLLHDATRDLDVNMFVCFSSMSSVVGAASRAHYAAANAFLDALAIERRRLGLPALTVSWGPWAGGGIADARAIEQFERVGNRPLQPASALEALDALLHRQSNAAHVMVAEVDWERFAAAYDSRGLGDFLGDVRPPAAVHEQAVSQPSVKARSSASNVPVISSDAEWSKMLSNAAAGERQALLAALLREEVAAILGFESPDDVPRDRPFTTLGMDSLGAADLTGRLRRSLGVRSRTAVFDYPTVEALSSHLLGEVALAQPQSLVTYTSSVEREILDFQRAAFPARREDLVAPRWRWMFVESARRLGVEPRMWLYRNSPALVGQIGAMPVKLKVHDEEHLTAWLVEAMVLQEYRSLAVGSRLMVAADAELPFSLSLGQEREMREIQFRLGWEQVVPLQTAQLLLRPDRVLKRKVGAPVALAAGAGLRAYAAARRGVRRAVSGDVREVARFGDAHDRLWQASAADFQCAVVRDASYLNWKYVEQPGQQFLRLELVRGDHVCGVVVCMFREPDDVYSYRRGFLVDVVAPFSNDRLLRDLLLVAARAAAERGADALTCLHSDGRLTKALQSVGFLMREPERVLLVRPGTLPDVVRRRILSPGAWHVTHGDSDIDRPW